MNRIGILHFALQPMTGPWSVMKELAKAQLRSGDFCGVGIGVLHDVMWPLIYGNDFKTLNIHSYKTLVPKLPGTLAFLLQLFNRFRIEKWVMDFANQFHADSVILHCHNSWMSGVFLPLKIKRGISVLFVSTFHGVNCDFENQPVRHGLHIYMARRLLKHGAVLTSVDSFNPALAQKILKIDKSNFKVIPNGVDDCIKKGSRYLEGRDYLQIGHVGSLIERKGWEITAKAVLNLSKSGRNVKFVIAGSGPEEEKVRRWANEYPEIIHYLGHVDDAAQKLMPDIDVLSVMSVREGLPMTIIEGMAAGVPVVATPVGGIPMAVQHDVTGYLVSRSAEHLTQALCKLYDEPNKLQFMSMKAQEVFQEKFHISRIVEQYAAVYGMRSAK